MPFFRFFRLANSWWFFSNARFRVSHSRNKNRVVALLGFSRLEFSWELVIRERSFLILIPCSRGHSAPSVIFWKRQKWKILIFRFCRYRGFRGEAPNAVIGFFPMVKCALRDLSDKTEICITFAYPAIAIFVFWRLVVTKIIQLIFSRAG